MRMSEIGSVFVLGYLIILESASRLTGRKNARVRRETLAHLDEPFCIYPRREQKNRTIQVGEGALQCSA